MKIKPPRLRLASYVFLCFSIYVLKLELDTLAGCFSLLF